MAASYSGFSRGSNLWLEQRSSVSVREHKAAVLVRPDLSYYRRADPKKTLFILSPGSVNLGCLVCFKERLSAYNLGMYICELLF